MTRPLAQIARSRRGARVAGYRLDEQIGRGGMAVVRFIRESRAAAVDHPNIIPVFAAGAADGVLFIAMGYVAGPDVATLIDSGGPLPAWQAVDIVSQPHRDRPAGRHA